MAENFKEAVCVDAGRVYDSCCDRDCLEDLRLFFNPEDQEVVNRAIGVRARSTELLTTIVDVEPITFNRGYYAVDMLFYFLVDVDLFTPDSPLPSTCRGLCAFDKKVILYGGEGTAKVFSSAIPQSDYEIALPNTGSYPTAYVQSVDPVTLSANLCQCSELPERTMSAPAPVLASIGGTLAAYDYSQRQVTCTLGIFTVVQLVRNVQMLMPVYDFCVPDKECVTEADDPCQAFNRLRFPMDQFFPPREIRQEESSCSACDRIRETE